MYTSNWPKTQINTFFRLILETDKHALHKHLSKNIVLFWIECVFVCILFFNSLKPFFCVFRLKIFKSRMFVSSQQVWFTHSKHAWLWLKFTCFLVIFSSFFLWLSLCIRLILVWVTFFFCFSTLVENVSKVGFVDFRLLMDLVLRSTWKCFGWILIALDFCPLSLMFIFG